MAEQDRQRWNDKYRRGEHGSAEPSRLLTDLDELLPRAGRALDLAGGAGRHAVWLAQRGLQVVLADISDTALELAAHRAEQAGVPLNTLQIDLEQQPLPPGPWDLIMSVHFLSRPLLASMPPHLAVGGAIVCIQPTVSNLARHSKPPRRFLLEDGELPQLVHPLEIVHYREGWLEEGRHEAVVVARRGVE